MKRLPLSICVILVGIALSSAEAGEGTVADICSWRFPQTWRTPVASDGNGVKKVTAGRRKDKDDLRVASPGPSEGWTAPDFDDRAWGRGQGLLGPAGASRDYGYFGNDRGMPYTLALTCLRGRLHVENPGAVRGLTLSLAYRGGAVVYVNGKEVARAHLPEGKLEPETPAEAYPESAFVYAPGKLLQAHGSHFKTHRAKMDLRIRRLESVKIDGALLRKGLNVVAVEIHRAPYFAKAMRMRSSGRLGRGKWSPCGPVSVALSAAGGVSAAKKTSAAVRVWNVSTLTRLTGGENPDCMSPLEPIRIVAARNGVFTGKVALSSASPIKGAKASAAELKGEGGSTIPASAVKVLYSVRDDMPMMQEPRDGHVDTLLESPPAEVKPVKNNAVLPVWVKVRVPADARPGLYRGRLTVSAQGLSETVVPVHMEVIDWKLPDPRDYRTHLGIVQSPDSVALQYKVPMWSEEHWKLIEESFKHLEEIGNRYVVIPLICHTNFGNEQTMVRWVKNGSGWKHDFTIAERYLDLALKYTRPDVVCLDLWEPYLGGNWRYGERPTNGKWKVTGPKVTAFDPGTGKIETVEGPKFDTPEAKKFWEPVLKGMSERIEKRGLKDAMMIGLLGDGSPSKEASALFNELLPGTKWVENGHHNRFGKNMNGAVAGYSTAVYINRFPSPPTNGSGGKRFYGWKREKWCDIFPRMHGPATNGVPLRASTPLPAFRMILEAALLANCSGLGRTGADFWSVVKGRKNKATTINARYPQSNQNQLNMSNGTEALLVPGPDGALTSARFEVLREGLYACEARIQIERAILDGKLDAALAKKCQAVLDERTMTIRAGCVGHVWGWYENMAPTVLATKLFECAAEVQKKLGDG
ncbi:MAG: glycoside hydrolase domain-containing protein [Planctomycetota bacterium]|jgi:hypothetical protein